MALRTIHGLGPVKLRNLYVDGVCPSELLRSPNLLKGGGKQVVSLRRQILDIGEYTLASQESSFDNQSNRAKELGITLITYGSPYYPPHLLESGYPVPILFARGCLSVLQNRKVVACVGSRRIAEPYSNLHHRVAELAARQGFAIASGFALGADTLGHKAAIDAGGTTIAVMPCGLDRPFPPENKSLWNELLNCGRAVAISESFIGTRASSLALKKRNKVIVGCSAGVMISQTSSKGGAMNAYRAAVEQKKPVATFPDIGCSGVDVTGNVSIAKGSPSLVRVLDVQHGTEDVAKWLSMLSSLT